MKGFQTEFFKNCMGVVIGLSMIFIMFVTAFEIACYSDYGFYEKEYEKYDVNNKNSIVNMSMEELVRVTKEMMSYLRGDRDDMVIYAQIDGEKKEMFHDMDKIHMADVRELFVNALEQRILCIFIAAAAFLLLALTNGWRESLLKVCGCVQGCIFILFAFLIGVAAAAWMNFTAVFYAMHHLLFDNENWMLDPAVSRLINILPEEFFVDMGIRIAIIFLFINFFILSLAFSTKRGMIKRNRNKISGGTYEQS